MGFPKQIMKRVDAFLNRVISLRGHFQPISSSAAAAGVGVTSHGPSRARGPLPTVIRRDTERGTVDSDLMII